MNDYTGNRRDLNYFYQPDRSLEYLPPEESSHCARVLRRKEGDTIWITDGRGHLTEGRITKSDARKCLFQPLHQQTIEAEIPAVHIGISPPKQMDRMEWFVEKATEIGISKITVLLTEHSERPRINLERLGKTAVSAMKQSKQTWLPAISGIIKLTDFVNQCAEPLRFIAELVPEARRLHTYSGDTAAVCMIGPEGGFSAAELDAARQADFQPVLLSNHRLRTETAALVACHTLHLMHG